MDNKLGGAVLWDDKAADPVKDIMCGYGAALGLSYKEASEVMARDDKGRIDAKKSIDNMNLAWRQKYKKNRAGSELRVKGARGFTL